MATRASVLKLVAMGLALSGCVGTPAYQVLQSDAPLPASDPAVRKTGTTPNLMAEPVGQTAQMSDSEKAKLEAELKRTGVRVNSSVPQSPSQSEATYRREVEAMRQEADNHVQKRLREIEARSQ